MSSRTIGHAPSDQLDSTDHVRPRVVQRPVGGEDGDDFEAAVGTVFVFDLDREPLAVGDDFDVGEAELCPYGGVVHDRRINNRACADPP